MVSIALPRSRISLHTFIMPLWMLSPTILLNKLIKSKSCSTAKAWDMMTSCSFSLTSLSRVFNTVVELNYARWWSKLRISLRWNNWSKSRHKLIPKIFTLVIIVVRPLRIPPLILTRLADNGLSNTALSLDGSRPLTLSSRSDHLCLASTTGIITVKESSLNSTSGLSLTWLKLNMVASKSKLPEPSSLTVVRIPGNGLQWEQLILFLSR